MVKEMACPSDENNGFIQITDPITPSKLNDISINKYPFTTSFAPQSILPTLSGNQLIESNATANTCLYQGTSFQLINIQICSLLHKGYTLPGQNIFPEAELIFTFKGNTSSINPYSGILLSFPIYQSNSPKHNEYLTQILNQTVPSCNYTNQLGFQYEGNSYQEYTNSSLNQCVQSCCSDINCLAYNYNNQTCSLKNNIPKIKNISDKNYIAGTVDHTSPNKIASCSAPNSNTDVQQKVATIESLFTSIDSDEQTSFSYKTCFDVIDSTNNVSSKNLIVFVFPRGIQLTSSSLELLKLKLDLKFPSYIIPTEIRDNLNTLSSYRFDSSGNKTFDKSDISKNGSIFISRLSSCTREFTTRFEYFVLSPQPSLRRTQAKTQLSSSNDYKTNDDSSNYYKTTQYKCVPFNQLTDLSGDYVIPGNKTLNTILEEQKQVQLKQKEEGGTSKSLTTDDIETYVAGGIGLTIAIILAIRIGSWISK